MPGHYCSLAFCRNNTCNTKEEGRHVSFHTFPQDPTLRRKWMALCDPRILSKSLTCARICSEHFKDEDFLDNQARVIGKRPIRLSRMAIPSRCLPPEDHILQPPPTPQITPVDKAPMEKSPRFYLFKTNLAIKKDPSNKSTSSNAETNCKVLEGKQEQKDASNQSGPSAERNSDAIEKTEGQKAASHVLVPSTEKKNNSLLKSKNLQETLSNNSISCSEVNAKAFEKQKAFSNVSISSTEQNCDAPKIVKVPKSPLNKSVSSKERSFQAYETMKIQKVPSNVSSTIDDNTPKHVQTIKAPKNMQMQNSLSSISISSTERNCDTTRSMQVQKVPSNKSISTVGINCKASEKVQIQKALLNASISCTEKNGSVSKLMQLLQSPSNESFPSIKINCIPTDKLQVQKAPLCVSVSSTKRSYNTPKILQVGNGPLNVTDLSTERNRSTLKRLQVLKAPSFSIAKKFCKALVKEEVQNSCEEESELVICDADVHMDCIDEDDRLSNLPIVPENKINQDLLRRIVILENKNAKLLDNLRIAKDSNEALKMQIENGHCHHCPHCLLKHITPNFRPHSP